MKSLHVICLFHLTVFKCAVPVLGHPDKQGKHVFLYKQHLFMAICNENEHTFQCCGMNLNSEHYFRSLPHIMLCNIWRTCLSHVTWNPGRNKFDPESGFYLARPLLGQIDPENLVNLLTQLLGHTE